MKLNNKGWGYRVFILCMGALSFLFLFTYHYLYTFVEAIR